MCVSDYLRRELETKVPEARGKPSVVDCGVELDRFPLQPAVDGPPAYLCVGALEGCGQRAAFARRHLPRFVVQLSKPKPPQKMGRPFPDDVNLIEWKLGGVLAFLRDDEWPHPPERGDLPVDMQHLRLEKRRAITSDDGTRVFCHVERSLPLLRDHCSSLTITD